MTLRILIVDDAEDTAVSMAYLLESMGHQVRYATDPLLALKLALDFRPEVAFLDIGMPKMDGWQLCRTLKASPGLAGLRCYAVSGYATAADYLKSEDAGFEEHFAKPAKLEDLNRCLMYESRATPGADATPGP